jgi:hypothetical protein
MKTYLILIPFLWILFLSDSLSAQDRISHQDYLEAIGLGDDYIVMSNILVRGLQLEEPGNTAEYYINNASFFSMVLLLSKVEPRDYYRLEEEGVDVLHAITADTRPISEQSLLADLVISGTVTEIETNTPANDGFDVSIRVLVDEVLKGCCSRRYDYYPAAKPGSAIRQPNPAGAKPLVPVSSFERGVWISKSELPVFAD